jgi:hypothetical protein
MITSQNKTHLKKLISHSLIFIDLNYIYFLFVLVLWVTAIRDILCMSLFSLKGNKIIFWREYYNQENIYLQTRKKCSFFIVQIHNNYVRIICQKTNFQKKPVYISLPFPVIFDRLDASILAISGLHKSLINFLCNSTIDIVFCSL